MKTLCYMYVFNYKALQNVEFVFDTKYKYYYDLENNTIEIQNNEKELPKNFWGVNITSITAIIGNNGAGKSTCLKLLLEELTSGYNKMYTNDVLIVLRDGDRFFYLTSRGDLNFSGLITQGNREERCEIPLLYFTNTSQLESPEQITCSELKGLSNATDLSLLYEDYKNYVNVDPSIFSKSLRELINIHSYKEANRYYDIFLNNILVKELNSIELKLPKYVIFSHNQSGTNFYQYHFDSQKKLSKDYDSEDESIICDINIYYQSKCSGINITKALYIHYSLVNLLNNQAIFKQLPAYKYLKSWKEYFTTHDISDNCYDKFEQLIAEEYGEIYYAVEETISILRELDRILEYHEDSRLYYMSLGSENLYSLKDLNDRCIKLNLLTGRIYDTFFQHEVPPSPGIHFSEGEKCVLKLISRLYYFLFVLPNQYSSGDIAQLILLDEAEIGLHPEWQRKYINLIINSINKIGGIIDQKFQVVLTTHSPIILSDIPKECANYLKSSKNGTSNVRDQQTETFATNVFQLYRNSFFLQEGLVGEFAQSKINDLLDRIRSGEKDGILKQIELIGDEQIKRYLLSQLPSENKQLALEYYRNRIKELENE